MDASIEALKSSLQKLIKRFDAEKDYHLSMVALVDRMLQLNNRKHSGRLAPSQLHSVEREITSTDAEIDDLVNELYGITEQERRIIEGAS